MIVKLLTEHHLEFLSLKGGCTGSSESAHVKMPHFGNLMHWITNNKEIRQCCVSSTVCFTQRGTIAAQLLLFVLGHAKYFFKILIPIHPYQIQANIKMGWKVFLPLRFLFA